MDEEMDGIASEQRKRLETIDTELEDVKRRLGRIWNAIETSDIDIADASDRVKEHRERKERLEDAAADARAILSQRRAHLDDVKTISAYAKDMKDFLQESELTERRSFIESFVKEIIVIPGDALIRYTMAGCAFSTRTGCAPSLALVPQTRISVMQSTQNNQVYMGGGTWKQLTSEDNCPGPCASTYRLGPLVERPARITSMGPPPFGDGNRYLGLNSALSPWDCVNCAAQEPAP